MTKQEMIKKLQKQEAYLYASKETDKFFMDYFQEKQDASAYEIFKISYERTSLSWYIAYKTLEMLNIPSDYSLIRKLSIERNKNNGNI